MIIDDLLEDFLCRSLVFTEKTLAKEQFLESGVPSFGVFLIVESPQWSIFRKQRFFFQKKCVSEV